MKEFSKRLRLILKEKKISQTELAKKILISRSGVNNYCTGAREATLDVLVLICKALNESADFLFGIEDYLFDFYLKYFNIKKVILL